MDELDLIRPFRRRDATPDPIARAAARERLLAHIAEARLVLDARVGARVRSRPAARPRSAVRRPRSTRTRNCDGCAGHGRRSHGRALGSGSHCESRTSRCSARSAPSRNLAGASARVYARTVVDGRAAERASVGGAGPPAGPRRRRDDAGYIRTRRARAGSRGRGARRTARAASARLGRSRAPVSERTLDADLRRQHRDGSRGGKHGGAPASCFTASRGLEMRTRAANSSAPCATG